MSEQALVGTSRQLPPPALLHPDPPGDTPTHPPTCVLRSSLARRGAMSRLRSQLAFLGATLISTSCGGSTGAVQCGVGGWGEGNGITSARRTVQGAGGRLPPMHIWPCLPPGTATNPSPAKPTATTDTTHAPCPPPPRGPHTSGSSASAAVTSSTSTTTSSNSAARAASTCGSSSSAHTMQRCGSARHRTFGSVENHMKERCSTSQAGGRAAAGGRPAKPPTFSCWMSLGAA